MKIRTLASILSITLFIPMNTHANIFDDTIKNVKDTTDKVTGKHGGKHGDKHGDDPFGGLGDMGTDNLGLDHIPGMDMFGGKKGGEESTDNKEGHHHHHKKKKDDEDDKKNHHKKNNDDKHHGNNDHNASTGKSDGGLFSTFGDIGKNTMGALGGVQQLSTDLNDAMLAAPGKIATLTNQGVDKIVSVEDQVIDATGMGNNVIGQTIKGVDHGVGDSIKQVSTDLAEAVRIYDTYMMGSGVASVVISKVSKNVKAQIKKENLTSDNAKPEDLLNILQTSLQKEGVDAATIQKVMQQASQGHAQQGLLDAASSSSSTASSSNTQSNTQGGHHGGHHHHHNQQQTAAPAA